MTVTDETKDRPLAPRVPLARASTIPSRYYTDPDIYAREVERVFDRTWQLVARSDELARPGDFVPVMVVDEPIVITHGVDGQLRAFYNVCRHRAGQVALTRGNRKSLQCHYHGWTYGLDGTLRACPEMEETEEFNKEDFGLQAVQVDRWGPFVFVCLDEGAPSLSEMLGDIPTEVAAGGYDVDRMRLVERREYVIACNWKVYVDNYLEGYHLPIAHP
ncbi:MAG: aromatic ring-hydroxylating dioxygenase subunit alpha, partial [Chloroflexota bacterium]|nr:aromatic ring-hydroxylating dioxygenase subunit alpha [Chloroflexota bacterium]